MTALTFMGWLALSYIGTLAIPAAQLDNFNTRFAAKVDAGDSCWDRVSGTPGTYGKPSDYTLDLACNYRLVKEQGTVYRLKRS
jgi:hypothetical protein